MEKLKLFFEDAKSHFEKEKLILHLNNHQRKIIILIIALVTILAVLGGWSFYSKKQSEKYSAILHQALVYERSGDFNKSNELLKTIYESSAPAGVRGIASLKYAAQILATGDKIKAIQTYLQINKTKNFDRYVREYSGLIALQTMIANDYEETKITGLILDLEKSSKIFKYYIAEQKAIFAWNKGDFKTAGEIFISLSQNPKVTGILKGRVDEMVEIYQEKIIN